MSRTIAIKQALVLDHGRPQRQLDREGAAVLAARDALETLPPAGLERPVLGQLGKQLQDVAADQLRRLAAEHAQGRLVRGVDPAVGAHREDAIEALLHDVAHQGVELLQLLAMGERELGLAAVDDPRQLRAISHQQGRAVLADRGPKQHGAAMRSRAFPQARSVEHRRKRTVEKAG